MNITREKLIAMWGLIGRISLEKTSVKFHYLIVKNKRLIEPEIKSIQEAQEPNKDYLVYEKERMDLCRLVCQKDDKGEPVEVERNFVIPDDVKEDFEKKMEEMKEKHKEAVDKMETKREQFTELIKEDVEIDFVKIPLSIMPENILGGDVDLLYELIDEDS